MTATFSLPRIRCHSVKLLPGARKKNIWRQKNRCGCTVWRDLFAECHTRQSSRVRQGSHITLTNPKLGTSRRHISGSIGSLCKGVHVGHLGKQKPMSSCTRCYLVKRWDIYNHLHRLCYFCTLTHSDTHTHGGFPRGQNESDDSTVTSEHDGSCGRVRPLTVYIPGDVEGVGRGAQQPPLREADGVEPVLPFPAVGEGDPGHPFAREHVASVLQKQQRA